jgi:predicted GIY-YIG superfamily endonuclease
MSTNIYILKLQGGRYYVGKTDNPMKRYQEHLNGSGSAWTRKYKPIGVEKVIEKASPFDEDRYVKEYMAKYGFHKVRGGSYVTEYLTRAQEQSLNTEIRAATDACTSCGRNGHFAKDCYAKTEFVQNSKPSNTKNVKNSDECYRCGYKGHYASNCYARKDTDGYELDSEDDYDLYDD